MAKTTTPKMKATKAKAEPKTSAIEQAVTDLLKKYEHHAMSLRDHGFNLDLIAADLKRLARRLDALESNKEKKGFISRIIGK